MKVDRMPWVSIDRWFFRDVWDRVHWIIDILLKSISQISLNVIDEEWKLQHDHPWMNLRQYSMGEKNQTMHLKVLIEKQDIRARPWFVYDLAPLIDVEDVFFYFYIDKVMYSFC